MNCNLNEHEFSIDYFEANIIINVTNIFLFHMPVSVAIKIASWPFVYVVLFKLLHLLIFKITFTDSWNDIDVEVRYVYMQIWNKKEKKTPIEEG